MENVLSFLEELARNNNREWFQEHKEDYLDVKRKVDRFTEALIAEVAAFDPEAAYLTPADCTYRIYRDTRFSPDKTPYKNHIGIFINPPFGKKSNRMGYYLHLEPGNCMAGCGTVCLPSKTVTAIRNSIRDNIEEYLEIINNPDFKKIYPVVGDNPVKSAPKGFDRNWEYIELVKPKDFWAGHKLSDKEASSPSLAKKVGKMFRIGKPFNDFVNYTIDEMGES